MKLLDILVNSIRASAAFNEAVQIAPDCILWPDAGRQWAEAVPLLLQAMPELFILGEYDPQKRQGPAIWLRCVCGGKVNESAISQDQVPVFYLPGVGRDDLRAVDSCPKALQPLAPLQFSGIFFAPNRDWTVAAWLGARDGGAGLDVARDNGAKQALRASLPALLQEDADGLRGKRLDSDFFNSLLTGGDPARDVLKWLDGEAAFRAARNENEWRAFVELCKSRFSFDPEKAGPLTAAENLARREGPWLAIWERYRESWNHYPNIEALIRKCSPPKGKLGWFLAEPANIGWPQWNDDQEEQLARELGALGGLAPHECAARLLELEKRHAPRRDALWAEIGEAPLAMALRELAALALISRESPCAGTVGEIARLYAASGWKVDDAALKAIAACAKSRDREIVGDILRNLYLPWLEECSRHLQAVFERGAYPALPCRTEWEEGDCLLFVDGLRMDCAQNLVGLLDGKGLPLAEETYWAPLPSLTATGKPAVSPVCGEICGNDENADFEPVIARSGKSLKGNLERLLADAGWEILKNGAAGDGRGRAWAEFGALDQEGHHNAARLAASLPSILEEIAKYVEELLAAGWKRVIVVSDHGWLWLPGGLPKCELAADLVENRWGRCAIPKSASIVTARKFPWQWNRNCYFALADGAGCFRAGQEYAHGGLSLQECLLLQITVENPAKTGDARLLEIKWIGLRCKLAATGAFTGLSADIRLEPGNPASSVAVLPKAFKADGSVSVVVDDEELEGRGAFIVLVDPAGRIAAQEKTVIGGCRDGNG